MNSFEKFLNVLSKNLGYTVVLVAAIILFAVFSDGLLNGIITALSAVIGYTCVVMLYKEYKKASATASKTAAQPATQKPAQKPAAKKPTVKKSTSKKTTKK